MEKIIKLALAILLGLCLFDMPYGFYQLVRFLAMIGFGILAFQANELKRPTETLIYAVLAVLFQPLFKISLGRELWNIVDAVVAIGLVITIVKK
jgi:urea transporter